MEKLVKRNEIYILILIYLSYINFKCFIVLFKSFKKLLIIFLLCVLVKKLLCQVCRSVL